MPQINVLVVPSDRFGVGKFRSIEPHIFLQNNFSEDFFVEIDLNPPLNNLEFYKKFQIVVYHRSITNDFDASYELVEKLKGLGIVTVCDMDDYWNPTKDHPIYDVIMYNKINICFFNNIFSNIYFHRMRNVINIKKHHIFRTSNFRTYISSNCLISSFGNKYRKYWNLMFFYI